MTGTRVVSMRSDRAMPIVATPGFRAALEFHNPRAKCRALAYAIARFDPDYFPIFRKLFSSRHSDRWRSGRLRVQAQTRPVGALAHPVLHHPRDGNSYAIPVVSA